MTCVTLRVSRDDPPFTDSFFAEVAHARGMHDLTLVLHWWRSRPQQKERFGSGVVVVAYELGDLPPPDAGRLVPVDYEVPLSRGRYLLDRQHQHRGRIAGFTLELSATIAGEREVIARIATSDGTVRMHTFARGGVEQIEVIERIPADSPSDFLDNAYLAAYDYLVSGADQLIQAWEGGRSLSADGLGTYP